MLETAMAAIVQYTQEAGLPEEIPWIVVISVFRAVIYSLNADHFVEHYYLSFLGKFIVGRENGAHTSVTYALTFD